MKVQLNPTWIKPSMTIRQATMLAHAHDCKLELSKGPMGEPRIVAIPRQKK